MLVLVISFENKLQACKPCKLKNVQNFPGAYFDHTEFIKKEKKYLPEMVVHTFNPST